jgi:hypothetical protein
MQRRIEQAKIGAEWALDQTHDSFAVAVESCISLILFSDMPPEPQQTLKGELSSMLIEVILVWERANGCVRWIGIPEHYL